MNPAFEKITAKRSDRSRDTSRTRTRYDANTPNTCAPAAAATAQPNPAKRSASNGRTNARAIRHGVTTNNNRFTIPRTTASDKRFVHRHAAPTAINTKRIATCCATIKRLSIIFHSYFWWARRDSNPHSFRNRNLNPACLPFHHAPANGVYYTRFTKNML